MIHAFNKWPQEKKKWNCCHRSISKAQSITVTNPAVTDGSGEDQGGDAEHHDSIFSRLEELRFNLEQQMSVEKFIEAYNKIKV